MFVMFPLLPEVPPIHVLLYHFLYNLFYLQLLNFIEIIIYSIKNTIIQKEIFCCINDS